MERLKPCGQGENGVNRENNMVDPNRWQMWMTLLDYVNTQGQPITMGDYALAMSFDNAPTVYNPDQADRDHDGVGDAIEDVSLTLDATEVKLRATLTAAGQGLAGQTIHFLVDANNDGHPEEFNAATDSDGIASITLEPPFHTKNIFCWAVWNGLVTTASDAAQVVLSQ
jgi:hypothetical protein